MKPRNMEAFDAYIKGETDVWPAGTRYEMKYIIQDKVIDAAFVDSNLKTALNHPMYGFFIAMALGLLEKDAKTYARYIPAIETFVKKTFDENDAGIKWENFKAQGEHLDAAYFVFVKRAGNLSPALQKLELRMMLKPGPLWHMWNEGLAGAMSTKEQLIERAKELKLPPEWFELWILVRGETPDGLTLGAHFKKLFKENRSVFDKVHRAFYWKWDGITVDDSTHPRTSQFIDSLQLLCIKLANGEGQEDLEDLKKNWSKYMKWDSGYPYCLLYEYGIKPLEECYTKYFVTECEALYKRLKNFFSTRHDWVASSINAVKAFVALKHGSIEDILFAQAKDPALCDRQVPPEVIHEIIAAYPEESRGCQNLRKPPHLRRNSLSPSGMRVYKGLLR
jgi:hypothetical protein